MGPGTALFFFKKKRKMEKTIKQVPEMRLRESLIALKFKNTREKKPEVPFLLTKIEKERTESLMIPFWKNGKEK